MFALAIRGLTVRKLRGVLTALAVFLGVAMVAGTLMLTDSVTSAFDNIFAEANAGVDVSIRPELAVEGGFDTPQAGTALPADLVDQVEAVDGVEQADGVIGDETSISILDEEGNRIGPAEGGAPHIVISRQPEPFDPLTYLEGEAPTGPDQVAIDSITADEEGYEPGQSVTITGVEGAKEYEISGIARFGSGGSLVGASLAVFTPEEAQRITGKVGEFDEIVVEAADGVSPEELRDRLGVYLPSGLAIRTGEEVATEDSEDFKEGFSFLTTGLLVFAGVALFVGAFLIFNTFSITVAQRTREFGMLRTLGASSRQVLATIILEAAVIGLLASALGIAGGLAFVQLINATFTALGFDPPQQGLVIEPPTIIVPLIVGLVATLVSATVPAIRATRVTPLEALREDPKPPSARLRRGRTAVATTMVVLAVLALGWGLFGTSSFGSALPLLGVGLILLFLGVAMLAGRIIRPLVSLIGRPIERLRGVTGQLARENTLRNPGRTATTAAALMIGVALVVFVAVFAESLKSSVNDALDRAFTGDLIIFNVDGFSPIPAGVTTDLAGVDGVGVVSPLAGSGAKIAGEDRTITGIDPDSLTEVADLDWQQGSDAVLAELGPNGAVAESDWASENGIDVGDALTVTAPDGGKVVVEVKGTVRDSTGLVTDSLAVPVSILREYFDVREDFAALVGYAPGADPDATRKRVDEELATTFPNAEARDQQQFKDEQREGINQLLVLIYVLLALSVFVSLFGVVNTLVLTVFERTRELGMLRAIGSSRRQIRRMIRYESLITAMIGAVIGAVIGVGIAVAAVVALEGEGLILSVPVVGIVVVLILAGVAGVLAGVPPARRAAKIEVMEALQYE
jgi:putative ABC transport system permease protein